MLAVLLAAGRGTRAGGPKAFLDLGGRSALEHCLANFADAGLGRVRVVLAADFMEDARRLVEGATRRPADVDLAANPHPERGQTSSLQIALSAGAGGLVEQTDFLLHTVDHPLVLAADIVQLLEAWPRRPAGASILAPSVGGHRGHPCLFQASLVAEFLALDEEAPAHEIIRADTSRVHHVLLDDPWLVRDIDQPDDIAAARAALATGKRRPG